jgi:hypothetical protein
MSRILAFSFVLLLAANALGQKVSASLDRAATSVGEGVTLSITCTNFTPSSQPMLPSIRGLRFSSGGEQKLYMYQHWKHLTLPVSHQGVSGEENAAPTAKG